jgi:acetyltransferase-like isoleucine patch superfamily enzyme
MNWPRAKKFAARVFSAIVHRIRVGYYEMLSTCRMKGQPTRYQPLQCVGLGSIEFNGRVCFGVFPSPFFLNGYCYLESRNGGAKISFGDGTWVNNNFVAICEHTSITIGKNVLVGTFVEIYDSNFHGLQPDKRRFSDPEKAADVAIEDNVFIGSNVKILKGVTIGRDSVIANGSIVTKSIPAGVVAGGNPARVIRSLNGVQ